MTPPRVVVFDLDDTLFPEREYVRSGIAAVAAFLERPDFATVAWELFTGGVRGRLFDETLVRLGLPVEARTIELLVERYRTHRPALRLFPEVDAVLAGLRPRCRLAIVSDGPLAAQERKIEALGLRGRFDPIVLTDRWGRAFWKPHERAFRAVEAATGEHGGACAYVGDNPLKDFVAPRALGWRRVRVRRVDGEHAAVPGGDADLECGDLAEAARALGL
jgi:putative hydrolase of the HAD superfamily